MQTWFSNQRGGSESVLLVEIECFRVERHSDMLEGEVVCLWLPEHLEMETALASTRDGCT